MSYYLKYKKDTARNVKFVNLSKQATPRLSASTLSEPYRALHPKLSTFEDVVRAKKEKKELKESKSSKNLTQKQTPLKISLIEEIDFVMEKCVNLIEKTKATALKQIETYIHCNCETDVKHAMTLWKDDYNLNLVHYAIIYKRPEIVQYLLAESCVFSPDSQPAICPYAHLAAYLGATASLKVILMNRPSDYFKCRLPSHEIQLPDHITQRFNLNKPIRKKKARFDEVLKTIKEFKKIEASRHSPNKVRSDDLNELITHLHTVYLEDCNQTKSLLPPINPLKNRRDSLQHQRIVKPRTYNQLFKDTGSTELEITDFFDKTPLTLAAERCHTDTVVALLDILFSKKYYAHRKSDSSGPLLRATKALSPEAVSTLLESSSNISSSDYQDSVLEALRQMLPGCLIALLSVSSKMFKPVFGGMNLYHMLYTQCLDADDDRYQMLPLMTRALVYCKQDVNSYTLRQTFPLYSLISSSFNASCPKNLYHTFECLWILFKAGANPYFVETTKHQNAEQQKSILRPAYSSIFNCIFSNTSKSLQSNTNPEIPLVIMKNSILFTLNMTRKAFVKSSKFGMNSIIFEYLEKACSWGLDRQILTKMISSGVDPDAKTGDRYALNVYFDAFFQYVLEFETHKSDDYYKNEMETLMILCHQMKPECLREAVKTILHQYVSGIPIQAVAVTRYFLYLVDSLLKHTYF